MASIKDIEQIYRLYDEDGDFCFGTASDVVEALNDYYAGNDHMNEQVEPAIPRRVNKKNWEADVLHTFDVEYIN